MKRKLALGLIVALLVQSNISINTFAIDNTVGNTLTESEASTQNTFFVNKEKTDTASYLYANDDGTFSTITAGDKIYIQTLDENYKIKSKMSFILNDNKFAGYYFDGTNHYIILAKDKNGKINTELYTINKYSLDGKKKGSVSILAKDTNIENTLVSGGVEITRNGNILAITDSVELTKSGKKGRQANIVFKYDMSYMKINKLDVFGRNNVDNYPTDTKAKPYVTFGHDNSVAVCWKTPNGIYLNGTAYTNENQSATINMFETYDSLNSKNNNITLDGFGASKSSYIVAGTSVTQDSRFEYNTDQNVFVSTVNKTQLSGDKVRILYITNYSAKDNIKIEKQHLIKKDDDNFILIWQENQNGKITVKYSPVSGDGNVTQIMQIDGDYQLSNCKPIYKDGNLIWFVTDKDGVDTNFYKIEA